MDNAGQYDLYALCNSTTNDNRDISTFQQYLFNLAHEIDTVVIQDVDDIILGSENVNLFGKLDIVRNICSKQ